MDNMEGKAPPKKKVVKSRAKPKPTATVNMLSSQDEPKKRVVKSRAKPKPTQPTEAINILSEAPTPQEEPKKKLLNQGQSLNQHKPLIFYQKHRHHKKNQKKRLLN